MLLVVGDFDCSGEDVERDWVARTGCWSRTERVLLTYNEVIREYELPATEGERGDPWWPAFARCYGFDIERPVQWEVEALEPAELQRLVLAAVDPYIDRAVLARQAPGLHEGPRRASRTVLRLTDTPRPEAKRAPARYARARPTAARVERSRSGALAIPAGRAGQLLHEGRARTHDVAASEPANSQLEHDASSVGAVNPGRPGPTSRAGGTSRGALRVKH